MKLLLDQQGDDNDIIDSSVDEFIEILGNDGESGEKNKWKQ